MSHVNRIRNAIRPYPQIEFSHTEGCRNKAFINQLTGERMNLDTPFGDITDQDAKSMATHLTIEDSAVIPLLKETQDNISATGERITSAIKAHRCPSDFVGLAERYEQLMERLPRIQNYLRKRRML